MKQVIQTYLFHEGIWVYKMRGDNRVREAQTLKEGILNGISIKLKC